MTYLTELRTYIEDNGKEADPEIIKAYALLRIAIALENIGLYAFGTDATRCGDARGAFEKLAVDLPEAIEEVASAIRDHGGEE